LNEQSPQPPPSTHNGKVFQPPARPADIASVCNSDYIVGLLLSRCTEPFTCHGGQARDQQS